MNNILDIKYAFYINLETRPDRKQHIEKQLGNVGIKALRFNAVKMANGALGCSISHLKCLEIAKKNNWPYILIVEDDLTFLQPNVFIKQFNTFLSNHTDFDVVLIAGNNVPPYKVIDDTCVQVTMCQTTTGYLVQNHYYDILIKNYRDGIKLLIENPLQHVKYAIDKYWFNLQRVDRWYLIIPLTVIQREDYSDIEKRPTNYKRMMIDLDKKDFFKKNIVKQNFKTFLK